MIYSPPADSETFYRLRRRSWKRPVPEWEWDAGRVSSQILAASGSALPRETETLFRPQQKNNWGDKKIKKVWSLFLSELGAAGDQSCL